MYELKRLILNKFFFLLAAVSGLYGYLILSDEIIYGIAYTAPFSPWSYGIYIAKVLPLLLVTLLFFITFLYSRQEKQVRLLTSATPVNIPVYCAIKCAAITAGFVIISLFVILISVIFYAKVFGFYNFSKFLAPIFITLIPAFLFIFGIGLLAGSIQSNILYALRLAALALGFFPLPEFFDIYGGTFFASYPLTLPAGVDGEPAFTLPALFIAGKIFFSAAGICMIFFGARRYKKI